MAPFRDALQKAIEPSKPLFEFVRMILTYYALCGLLLLIVRHWEAILASLSPSSRPAVYLGSAGIVLLLVACITSLAAVIYRFVTGLVGSHHKLWVAVVKFLLIIVALALLTAMLPLILNLTVELMLPGAQSQKSNF